MGAGRRANDLRLATGRPSVPTADVARFDTCSVAKKMGLGADSTLRQHPPATLAYVFRCGGDGGRRLPEALDIRERYAGSREGFAENLAQADDLGRHWIAVLKPGIRSCVVFARCEHHLDRCETNTLSVERAVKETNDLLVATLHREHDAEAHVLVRAPPAGVSTEPGFELVYDELGDEGTGSVCRGQVIEQDVDDHTTLPKKEQNREMVHELLKLPRTRLAAIAQLARTFVKRTINASELDPTMFAVRV